MLKAEDLTKNFGAVRALDKVTVEVPQKSLFLIIGPNGSGKSTLLNCISGVLKPDNGKVLYREVDLTGKPPHEVVRNGIVKTFQIPMPFYKLTVLENVLLAAQENPGENAVRSIFRKRWINYEKAAVQKGFKILKLLKLYNLWDAPAYTLSGGQLKLLEIAKALMADAKVILMDEPVGSINPVLAHEIFSFILKLKNELGLTFLLVEHRLEIAFKYVDYVYAMAAGKIIAEAKPDDILNDQKVIESYTGFLK